MDNSRRAFIRRAIGAGTFAAVPAAAEAQAPGVRGFDHVALPMQNVDAMLAFYRALGFQVNEGPQVCSVHFGSNMINVGSSRVDLQACKLEYSIVSPK